MHISPIKSVFEILIVLYTGFVSLATTLQFWFEATFLPLGLVSLIELFYSQTPIFKVIESYKAQLAVSVSEN